MHFEMFYYKSLHVWRKHELLINFFFHKLKLNCCGVRHYFHTMLAYCPCLISHSTDIYHFRRVPKMLPNKRFESGGGIFNGNTGIFRRHSGCLLLPLLLLLFFSFSFFRFRQARRSKGALLPPQVTNRSLDSSQILRDRFLTRREISSSLILIATPLVIMKSLQWPGCCFTVITW